MPEQHHYGLIRLPGTAPIGCLSAIVREDAGAEWVELGIPMGMLDLVFQVRHPLYPKPNPWMPIVDHVLLEIAEHVYAEAPFDLAALGEEAGAVVDPAALTAADLPGSDLLVPESRLAGLGNSGGGQARLHGLWWFPNTTKGRSRA